MVRRAAEDNAGIAKIGLALADLPLYYWEK
jgi:hypothetical protein